VILDLIEDLLHRENLGVDLLGLKSAGSPVPRTAASVGDCDDLNFSCCNSVNYAVRKPPKEKFPRIMQMLRPTLRTGVDWI
jgi:hypothetical protein